MPGFDPALLKNVDHQLACARIREDCKTDFIIAPHFRVISIISSGELWSRTAELLRAGRYEPDLPLTISVPGPDGFTRPGSILQPVDRLVYQILADTVAPTLEANLDRSRVFSHVLLLGDGRERMFDSDRASWGRLQSRVQELARSGGYFVKADVSNYFERLPQHHLVNLLSAVGCAAEATRLIEEMFFSFQQRNSFGIVQGVFPSDLLGNFFLSALDANFDIHGIPSARYMDDIYLHFGSHNEALRGLAWLIEQLRRDGLHVNPKKTRVIPADNLILEETALDRLFAEACEQVEVDRERMVFDSLYGTGVGFDIGDGTPSASGLAGLSDIEAVKHLFESISEHPEQADSIERFCLPLLGASGSDLAVDSALGALTTKPHMYKVYLPYLGKFADTLPTIRERLDQLLETDACIYDHQLMYLLWTLFGMKQVASGTAGKALVTLEDRRIAQEARAIAALVAAKHGSAQQRRLVKTAYDSEPSPYVRGALLLSSNFFTSTEKKICRKAWGGHGLVNSLLAQSLSSI